ncbi:hypothetical protein RRG08_051827 [Elysia crispata]|uniref:Uncharacterized protein n=1 Tax=Elysia crispata TaxID=231223 RepID=A0AAE0Z995_9GAST|nr:hypothetical protein RRG08_051827 [Elysia crispata]
MEVFGSTKPATRSPVQQKYRILAGAEDFRLFLRDLSKVIAGDAFYNHKQGLNSHKKEGWTRDLLGKVKQQMEEVLRAKQLAVQYTVTMKTKIRNLHNETGSTSKTRTKVVLLYQCAQGIKHLV